MNSYCFSQGLSPQVQIIENDTLFCFTIGQSKTIAKHLANSVYCDSLEIEYITNIDLLREINSTKDITIANQEHKLSNLSSIIDNNSQSINGLLKVIQKKDKKLRRSRSHKKLLTLGIAIAATIAIIK